MKNNAMAMGIRTRIIYGAVATKEGAMNAAAD
jgi:hypothetical protein